MSASFAPPRGRRGVGGAGASVHTARPMGASRVADTMPTGRVLDAAAADLLAPRSARADEPAETVAGMAPSTVFDAPRSLPCARSMSEGDGLFVEGTKTALARTGTTAASGPADCAGARGAKAALPGDRAARGTRA